MLMNMKNLKKKKKKKKERCLNLEGFLKDDIDGLDLFSVLKVLTEIL
jgi:hypothetical protein